MPNWNVSAKEIGNLIWNGHQGGDLTYTIEKILQDKGLNINDQDLLENFDKLKRLVSKFIQRKIENCTSKGVTPKYKFSEADRDILILQIEQTSEKIRKEIQSTIRRFSWRTFEHFCVYMLKMSGVNECEAMRGRKEEGIDFFGVLNLGQATGASIWHGVRLRVLGQAKKSQVSEPTVRLFNQDKKSFLNGEGRAFQLAPKWFKTSHTPLIGFVLTSRRFTTGAVKWASRHDIVVKDIQQMIEDLLNSADRTPGLRRMDGRIVFEKKNFVNYFEHLQ